MGVFRQPPIIRRRRPFFLSAAPVAGDIAFDAMSSNTSSANATTLSVNHTASGSDRVAVVIVHLMRNASGGIAVTSATYGGNAMTERASIQYDDTSRSKTYRTSIYTYVAPPTSSTAVQIDWDTAAIASAVVALSYTGVNQSDPFDAAVTLQLDNTAAAELEFETGVTNAMIVGGAMLRGGDTDPFTPGTITERYDLETGTDTTGDFGAAGGELETTTAGGYTFSLTAAVADYGVMAAISLVPAAGGGGGTTYEQGAAGTLSTAGAVVRSTGKPLAGALTSAGAIVRSAGKALAGTVTTAGAVVKSAGKGLAGTLTSAGALAGQAQKALAGTLGTAGTVARTAGKTLAGTLDTAGDVARQTAKSFAGTLDASGAVTAVKTALINLAGELTSAGVLARSTGKALAGSLASSGAVGAVKTALIALAGTLDTAGTVARSVGKSAAGTLATAGEVARSTGKSAAGTLSAAGDVTRQTGKALAGTLSPAGVVSAIKTALVNLAGALDTAGNVTRSTGKALAGGLTSGGNLIRRTGKALAGVLDSSGAATVIKSGFVVLAA